MDDTPFNVEEHQEIGVKTQLTYPLDPQSRQAISRYLDDVLQQKIFDLTWIKLFRYQTFFENVDTSGNNGFTITIVGTGTTPLDGTLLGLVTSGNSSDSVLLAKSPTYQNIVTFNQASRFRTSFFLTSIAAQTIYIIVGSLSTYYYGFKIVNGTIYGVTYDGTTENTVNLGSVAASTIYNVEARYFPSNSVTFWIASGTTSSGFPVPKGTSTANLPPPVLSGVSTNNGNLFTLKITTNEAVAKRINFSFFEYQQLRSQIH